MIILFIICTMWRMFMICSNCGAQLDDGTEVCPYCGASDDVVIDNNQTETLRHLHDETDRIVNEPDRIVNRTRNTLWKLAIAGTLLLVALLVIFWIVCSVGKAAKSKNEQYTVNKLEKYYSAGDYEKIYDWYYNGTHDYSFKYEKYRIVADLYSDIKYSIDCDSTIDYVKRHPGDYDSLTFYIKELMTCVADCDSYESQGYIYDEEKCVEDIREIAENVLTDKFKLTEKEISDLSLKIRKSEGDSVDMNEVAKMSADRL